MPIVNNKPSAPTLPPQVSVKPDAVPPKYQGVVVDTRYTPLSQLLQYIEGSEWRVDYWSQIIDQDSEVAPQQLDRAAVYQQYRAVKNYELKLQGNLNQSYNNETGGYDVTGTALTYPFLIPQEGDMFVADIGDGRAGVFTVTSSTPRTILKQTCYEIGFVLVDYASELRRKDLDSKTVQTYYFQKDFLKYGQNPLISEADVQNHGDMRAHLKRLLGLYMARFFSNEYQTLILPNQHFPSYDHFLTKFVVDIFDTSDHPLLRKIRVLNCDGDEAMKSLTFWDVLRSCDQYLLPAVAEKMWLVRTSIFSNWPAFKSVYFSGVPYLTYPMGCRCDVDALYQPYYRPAGRYLAGGEGVVEEGPDTVMRLVEALDAVSDEIKTGELELDTDAEPLDDAIFAHMGMENEVFTPEAHLIHPVTKDDFYVFTEAFYLNSETGQSELEALTNGLIKGNPIDQETLIRLCNSVPNWGLLEKFYYIPVLFVLLKVAIRDL